MIQVTKPQWGKMGKGKGKDKGKGKSKGEEKGKSAFRKDVSTRKGEESENKGKQRHFPTMRRIEAPETSNKEEEGRDRQPDEPTAIFPWRDPMKQKGKGKQGTQNAPKGRKESQSHKG